MNLLTDINLRYRPVCHHIPPTPPPTNGRFFTPGKTHFYTWTVFQEIKSKESVTQPNIIMMLCQGWSVTAPLQHNARITFTLPPACEAEARVAVTAITAQHVVTGPVPADARPHDALVHVWGARKADVSDQSCYDNYQLLCQLPVLLCRLPVLLYQLPVLWCQLPVLLCRLPVLQSATSLVISATSLAVWISN